MWRLNDVVNTHDTGRERTMLGNLKEHKKQKLLGVMIG